MQKNKILLKSALGLAFVLAISSTSLAAGCRTETRFNEFTRTWSTNDVCDFGSVPVNNSWSFSNYSYSSYAPSYIAPTYVAPTYAAPVAFSWSLPAWGWSFDYYEPVAYTLPVTDYVVDVPTYLDSGTLQTPVDIWHEDSSSWVPGWVEEPVDRFIDSWGDFFVSW